MRTIIGKSIQGNIDTIKRIPFDVPIWYWGNLRYSLYYRKMVDRVH